MQRASIPAVVAGDLNLLRCLAGRGIHSTVVAWDRREPTLRSRFAEQTFVIAPPSEPDRALADLEQIASGFDERPILYFGQDSLLLLVSRARERLERRYRFSLPSADLVEMLVDKAQFADLARRNELPIPESVRSDELLDARDLLTRLPLPFAFKPNVHIGWLDRRAATDRMPRKALRADTKGQAVSLYDELSRQGPFVVQHWVDGGEDAVLSFHAYVDARSRMLGWFVGRKIRTYPKEAGVSTYLELVHDFEVARLGFDIVKRLGVVGPLKIDFKRDATTGRLYVLELNARFTLWCYLGMVCGVNLPALAYADLLGLPVPDPTLYRTDIRWLSFPNDLRTFLRSYRPSKALGLFDWLASYRSKKVYDVFSWSDPAPSAASLLDYAQRATRRISGRSRLATT
jgi:predicted ATP-grasp superfamily ATP-dependent carboligase